MLQIRHVTFLLAILVFAFAHLRQWKRLNKQTRRCFMGVNQFLIKYSNHFWVFFHQNFFRSLILFLFIQVIFYLLNLSNNFKTNSIWRIFFLNVQPSFQWNFFKQDRTRKKLYLYKSDGLLLGLFNSTITIVMNRVLLFDPKLCHICISFASF